MQSRKENYSQHDSSSETFLWQGIDWSKSGPFRCHNAHKSLRMKLKKQGNFPRVRVNSLQTHIHSIVNFLIYYLAQVRSRGVLAQSLNSLPLSLLLNSINSFKCFLVPAQCFNLTGSNPDRCKMGLVEQFNDLYIKSWVTNRTRSFHVSWTINLLTPSNIFAQIICVPSKQKWEKEEKKNLLTAAGLADGWRFASVRVQSIWKPAACDWTVSKEWIYVAL